jgi:type 1 fimbria pilin
MQKQINQNASHVRACRPWLGGVLVAALCLVSAGARSQDGSIQFVGAVVTPTCQVAADANALVAAHAAAARTCGSERDGSVRAYQLQTDPIQANSGDRVLRYFFDYVTDAANHAQQPVLMTLQYD